MAIERDLHELLYLHDCVIVPHWGGFLTHYRPARLDGSRKLVHPPGKDLSFNRNLTRDDGLLTDRMAKHQGLDFAAAAAQVQAEVEVWRRTLQEQGRLELAHIGIFYRDTENNLQFDPDKRADHLKDSFGLRPVAAVPVERPKEVPVIPMPLPHHVASPPARRRFPVAWAAAAATLLIGAGTVWMSGRGGAVQWGSLSPFGRAERSYGPVSPVPPPMVARAGMFTLPENGTGVHVLPLQEGDSVMVTVDLGGGGGMAKADSTHVALPVAAVETPAPQARFHVVGGCFAQPENADRFLAELRAKGHQAHALPKRAGLYPVAYGSYVERADALRAMEAVRAEGSGQAWLLVR